MKGFPNNRKQILAVLLFVLVVFLMMDLNNRLNELFRLSEQRDHMQTEVYQYRRTEQALVTLVAYATSESAVDQWAYEEGHKNLPGDNVIVPLPPDDFAPSPTPVIVPTVQPVENWEVWRALFMGE